MQLVKKKIYGSSCPSDLASCTVALIISNEDVEGIMKIVKSLKESGFLIKKKKVKQLKMKQKNKKRWISSNLIWNISF